jgi:hypothetical protein
MSLVQELSRVVHKKRYDNITFSINGIPIITVNLLKDEKVIILVNNMNELRYYELHYGGDTDKFASEVSDVLVYSGVDSIIRKMRGSSIRFYGDPYLEGEVMEGKLIISQGEVDLDEEDGEVVRSDKHEIAMAVGLTGVTISKIITAFALQYYT